MTLGAVLVLHNLDVRFRFNRCVLYSVGLFGF